MKIISYLNVSNISNLEADSGFVFQNILLSTLYQRSYEVFLIGPCGMNGLLRQGIIPINIDFSDTKYGVRLGFCWNELKQKLIQIPQCDILMVNQSELLISLKTLIYEVWRKEIPCITYFHYLPIQSMDEESCNVSFDSSQNLFHLSWHHYNRVYSIDNEQVVALFFCKSCFDYIVNKVYMMQFRDNDSPNLFKSKAFEGFERFSNKSRKALYVQSNKTKIK